MRKALVAGNWKMNGTRALVAELVRTVVSGMAKVETADVAVCPSFPYLCDVAKILEGSSLRLGAQDVAKEESGAYTGEVSADMLLDCGCQYVIVGHSERRNLYGESDVLVAQKFAAAQKHGLTPILCVGELLEEREAGHTESVVVRQLKAVVELNGVAAFKNAVIAYEPIWAIGTGKTATPEQAQGVHAFIREVVRELDATVAQGVQILYGGSVKAGNAKLLFSQTDIDGGLIGGASLDAQEFLRICEAAG